MKRYGDKWEVLSSLGEGGQAHTFLVRDVSSPTDKTYVLKRLKNRDRLPRFAREIRAVAGLDHPNIVRLVDQELAADPAYLVAEFCEGGSLDKAHAYWQDSPAKGLELFRQVCDAVAYAHAHNVIHRDIKPANVFLRSAIGPALLGDFGLCLLDTDTDRFTETTEAVGPRLFMAPELEDGRLEAVPKESDVYSLGKLLYWLLSKNRIFAREKHRDPSWDLKGWNPDTLTGWTSVYMEHVNRLLDFMIVADPKARRPAENLSILAKQAIRLVGKEYCPVQPGLHLPCAYCGQGVYRQQPSSPGAVSNFGFSPVGAAEWRILVCSACGHVQLFRIENIDRKEWWGGT